MLPSLIQKRETDYALRELVSSIYAVVHIFAAFKIIIFGRKTWKKSSILRILVEQSPRPLPQNPMKKKLVSLSLYIRMPFRLLLTWGGFFFTISRVKLFFLLFIFVFCCNSSSRTPRIIKYRMAQFYF